MVASRRVCSRLPGAGYAIADARDAPFRLSTLRPAAQRWPGRRSRSATSFASPVVVVRECGAPSSIAGEPDCPRHLDAEMAARTRALATHSPQPSSGVAASGEDLDGPPARRLVEFMRPRGAR
jgi:hypothetical protein